MKDIIIDEPAFRVTTLVVDVGGLFLPKDVMLPPDSVELVDPITTSVHLRLGRDEVEAAPLVLGGEPIQAMPSMFPLAPADVRPPEESERAEARASFPFGAPGLHSLKDLHGAKLLATDGEIGHVDDALIDITAWHLAHLVIDTRNWLPGKHVVVDAAMVRTIDWGAETVSVQLTREEVEKAPTYDPLTEMSDQYQDYLSRYYHSLGTRAPL